MKDNSPIAMPIAKREFNGDVSFLLGVQQLRPLAEFPIATRPISDHLHSLGHGWYLLVGSRSSVDDGLPAETVRACMVVWARDLAGMLLVTGCEDTVGPLAGRPFHPLPPAEILVSAPGWSYAELVKAGRGKVTEGGVYGPDGKWKFKEMWFPKATVYFRSRRRKTAELPFAISIVGPNPTEISGGTKGGHS